MNSVGMGESGKYEVVSTQEKFYKNAIPKNKFYKAYWNGVSIYHINASCDTINDTLALNSYILWQYDSTVTKSLVHDSLWCKLL